MKYLITNTEVYRVETEEEAELLINEAKADTKYVLTKYNCEKKERKQKGEVIDSYFKVSLVKSFNDEKDPVTDITVSYEVQF
jgi:hypothetical protein